MKRLIAGAFAGGVILGSGGSVDLPVTVLPSLAFIILAHVGLALWDLRHVLARATPRRQASMQRPTEAGKPRLRHTLAS